MRRYQTVQHFVFVQLHALFSEKEQLRNRWTLESITCPIRYYINIMILYYSLSPYTYTYFKMQMIRTAMDYVLTLRSSPKYTPC